MPDEMNLTGQGIIGIQGISGSTVNVTQIIGRSGEFRELKDHLNTLQKLFDRTPETEIQERLELSEKIGRQKAFIESFKQDILKLAETFDRIELNTERLKKAKEYFDSGEITEARVLLEDAEEERADKVVRALAKQKESREILQNAAAEYLILAQATAMNFENPNRFEDTCRYYEQSIAAYPSFYNLSAHVYFLQTHNQYEEALIIYESINREFASDLTPEARALTLNNLALLHSVRNEHETAEAEYIEALGLYRELAKKNPQAYLTYVAMTLNNLAVLHRVRNEHETAEAEYIEALVIFRELAEKNPQAYLPEVAGTLNNLALLRHARNDYESAEVKYVEALAIRRELAEKNPQVYLPDVAATLNNLANLHCARNEHEAAEAEYIEALTIRRELVQKNPQAYLPGVAMTLINLANLHSDMNEHEPAEAEYIEALALYRKLAEKNLEAYLPYVATALNNMAGIHYIRNEYEDVESKAAEALALYRGLAEKNPQAYLPDVAKTLGNFASFYQGSKPERERSIALALEAVKILLPFVERVPVTQKYFAKAMRVLKNWGMSEEEIMAAVSEESAEK